MKSVEAKQHPFRGLAFFADSMHGSLARKLRIFGMDTAYSSSITDEHILNYCSTQRRILLTSDKELFRRSMKKRIGSVHLQGLTDRANMVKIFAECNIKNILYDPASARCPICNIELEKKEKKELGDLYNKIPPKSYLLNSHFYQCKGCRKVYWEGSHKAALDTLAESINQELYTISCIPN